MRHTPVLMALRDWRDLPQWCVHEESASTIIRPRFRYLNMW